MNAQPPPTTFVPTLPAGTEQEINIVKLAREIAMDLRELDQILKQHGVTPAKFEELKRHPYFVRVLSAEVEAWESATNTSERVKLKAAAMMEEWLPSLYGRITNPDEDLMKVVKGGELVVKVAGLNADTGGNSNPSDKVVITINMGADNKLQVAKTVTPQVIEHDANELQQSLFEESLEISPNVSSD